MTAKLRIDLVTPDNVVWHEHQSEDVGDINTLYLSRADFDDIGRFGFLNRTETTISFDGTNTFTLTSVGASWSYWRSGVKYTITGSKSKVLATPMVNGALYYIYIDATDGTLSADTGGWTLNDTKVPVATLKWNSTLTPKYVLCDERHTCGIDRKWHREHHFVEGTKAKSLGTVSGLVANSSTPGDKTFGISGTQIFDEDLYFAPADLADPDGATPVYYNLYRTSASSYEWAISDMPFKYADLGGGTYGFIEYDLNGTSTPMDTANRYCNTYIFVSNSVSNTEANPEISTPATRYFIMQGRGIYTTEALAQAEQFAVSVGMPVAEGVALYRLTWKNTGIGSSVKGRCQFVSQTTVASNITTSAAIPVTLHNDLAGIDGGTAGEYYHFTSAQHTDLTDAGDSTLHYHASDRNSANFTGTNWTDLTDGGVTTLHDHARLQPDADGTTAVQLQDKDGNAILNVDTTNDRVGIGTTAPGAKLVVAGGNAQITGSGTPSSGAGVEIGYDGTYGNITAYNRDASAYKSFQLNALDQRFMISGTEKMRIDSSGNVGIGTTSPVEKLYVSGATNDTDIEWVMGIKQPNNTSSGNPYGAGIKFHLGDVGENTKWSGIAAVSESVWGNSSGIALYADESERMRIKNNGNVGIGTTAPGSKLDIIQSSTKGISLRPADNRKGLNLYSNTDDAGATILFGSEKGSSDTSSYGIPNKLTESAGRYQFGLGTLQGASSLSRLSLFYAPNGTNQNVSEGLVLQGDGNVGIGTTSPQAKLDVSGDITLVGGTAGGFTYGSAPISNTRLYAGSSRALILGANGITNHLTIDTSGNVGIGTTSPNEKLEVNGNVRVSSLTASQPVFTDANKNLVSTNTNWTDLTDGGSTTLHSHPGTAGDSVSISVTQASHGFSTGNSIYFNGTNWAKAKADATTTVGTHIASVTDVNTFIAYQSGKITVTSHGFSVGAWLFTSASTAGALTATEPDISNPMAQAIDANTLHVHNFRATDKSATAVNADTLDGYNATDFGILELPANFQQTVRAQLHYNIANITDNQTIPSGYNCVTEGPIELTATKTIEISSGSFFEIL